MKIAIMQPYFFPYLGYYSLIKKTDRFVLFDTVQFIKHGWIERNRILKPAEGWQYVAAPLEKSPITTIIKEMKINNKDYWKGKLFRQLEHYKKKSPFYKETMSVVENALDIETDSIVKLNASILEITCEYIGIQLNMDIFSEMNLSIDLVTHPGEWALNITKSLDGSEYINPVGGVEIFRKEQFEAAGIALNFMGNNLSPYSQRRGVGVFEAGLSIIDVMMFNDPEQICKLIDDTYYHCCPVNN
ncbi:MAG: WbqC family protein [Desulfuromonadaceae bacterium]|nr:WbqC family protein [Desulfuromonadaceae bacterium]